MLNEVKRLIRLGILLFFGIIFGNIYISKTLSKILGKQIKRSKIIIYSSICILIFYILMFISIFIIPSFFNILYYLLFLLLGFYINLLLSSFIYYFILLLGKKLNKYINLFIFLGLGILLTIIGIINERGLKIEKITIKCNNIKGNIKIAHLTDIHLGAAYGKNKVQNIVDLLKKENDINFIVITGDLVDGNIIINEEILEPFSQIKIPKYFVTGNHESFSTIENVLKIIKKNNITHIKNENLIYENKLNLIGMDYNKNFNLIRNNLSSLIPKNNLTNIFLHHVPLFKVKDLSKYNIFLFLSGHTHGGQIFPMHIIHYLSFASYFGLYNFNNSNYIYIPSGVGTSGPVLRTFSRASIGVINLEGI